MLTFLNVDEENDFKQLTQISDFVDENEDVIEIIDELKSVIVDTDTLYNVCAPELGINKQILAISLDKDKNNIEIYINPEMVKLYPKKTSYYKETCSVIPEKTFVVNRYRMIKVKYTNENGKRVKKLLRGYEAVAFQHSFDHLYGILANTKSISQELINSMKWEGVNNEE